MSYTYDKKHLQFGHSTAVNDSDVLEVIKTISLENFSDVDINRTFCKEYLEWIKRHSNKVTGLDEFKYAVYSHGTSEAFDKFYLKNSKRRFRCYKGEYMYHKLAWRDKFVWNYIEDEDLHPSDAVVISLPFADTGDKHVEYHDLMRKCCELGIPVLIDCAYFGACYELTIDLAYNCITDVVFSLSKTFPVAYARIGMRYTKEDDDDTMFVYHKISYNNKLGAQLGMQYINSFTPDFIPQKYMQKQKDFCTKLNVHPSNTILFGIDYRGKYSQYNRGGTTNRLSFHKQYIRGLN